MFVFSRMVTLNLFSIPRNCVAGLNAVLGKLKYSNASDAKTGDSKDKPSSKIPVLPVPPLKDTLKRFLKSASPFLTNEEYTTSCCLAQNFERNQGCKLQALLEKRAKEKEDWLAEWWVKYAYLAYRVPVTVYSNPGLIFPKLNICSLCDQITTAADATCFALQYKKKIDENLIPQEKMGNRLLDMGQYKKFLGTCRIPGKIIDSIEYNPTSQHIIFIYKNNIFKVPVYGCEGEILSEANIRQQFSKCIQQSCESAVPIGMLTADKRDNWGCAYEELIKDCDNKKSVSEIHKALFVVAIDDHMPNQQSDFDLKTACLQAIHGGYCNSGNRWFDKTLQFFFGPTGMCGICYEHTPAEGQPVAFMVDEIVSKLLKETAKPIMPCICNFLPPEKLSFNVSCELKTHLEHAKKTVQSLVKNYDQEVLHFTNYGKDTIKKFKVSPDSFIQMAIQLAYVRLHSKPAAQYETGHTRAFIHGRTETIRTCSPESYAFVKAMLCGCDPKESAKALLAAVKAHKELTQLAMSGLGIDRHLLALKLIAKENNMQLDPLFEDKAYVVSSRMVIATSQVASKYESVMGYGPIYDDGYACCYNPRSKDMILACSCMKNDCMDTSAKAFANALCESFMEMKKVMESDTKN